MKRLANLLVADPTGGRRLVIVCSLTFAAALAVRLLYFQDSRAELLYGGSFSTNLVFSYEYEASRIANEGGLLFPNEAVDKADARMIAHPPGYPLLLATAYHVLGIDYTQEFMSDANRPIRICNVGRPIAELVG